ncbi:hypothetical protein JOD29_004001 [Lysinibacillus composti]|uniref:DUF2269 family protein n=2 Tax=Lysinibacillus composti TaxID=720633 RepID=A0A3N9U2W2_9BACI|nr:hypothetical protein [Lysinibacillus composti]MBM7610684.1 hypothetical protein [Lysinibacillus composti]RQW70973.1 hypothetical protein EBB45_19570 [Lysinibacillus composti]
MFHTLFLYIHVLSAVVSIGPLFALIPILKRMEKARESEMSGFVQSFQSAITVVKHAGHVLVISGVMLIVISGWTWTTSWVLLTNIVMVGSIVFLARAFKPTIQTFGTAQYNRHEFILKLRRKTWQYIGLLLIMLWLMVVKPSFW